MDKASKPHAGKAKIDQWDYKKKISLCTAKKQSRVKRQITEWEKAIHCKWPNW
jgi:hypothetical protein